MLQVDRLYEAVAEKSPVCVGLDTDFSYIPAECVDKTLFLNHLYNQLPTLS